MANLSCSRTNRKHSSLATKHFQNKSLKIFDLHPLLRRLVSFLARIITWKVRCWVTDTHTDTQTKYCNTRCAYALRVNEPDAKQISSNSSIIGYQLFPLSLWRCRKSLLCMWIGCHVHVSSLKKTTLIAKRGKLIVFCNCKCFYM